MTEEPAATGSPHPSSGESASGRVELDSSELERDAVLAWVGENLDLVRRSASGQRVLYWILATGSVIGLAAHIGGFLLKSSAAEPLLLAGDLLYSLGMALWTGIVVALCVQVWPAIKKRQFRQVLDAYEAAGRRDLSGPATNAPSAEGA